MHKPIAIALLVLLSLQTGTALAQRGGDGQGNGRRPGMRRALNRELGLSPEQKQRILQIQRQHANNPDKRQMWRQIRGVLTPEQMQHLRQIRRNNKNNP